MRRLFLLVSVLLALSGCSGERNPPVAAPGVPSEEAVSPGSRVAGPEGGAPSLRIEPAEVRRGTPVRLSPAGFAIVGATVSWLVNGKEAAGLFDPGTLRKADTLQARVDTGAGRVLSQVVTVRNSPPEIRSVRFLPGDGRPGNAMTLEAEPFDADGDTVEVRVEWKVNGEPAGKGNRPELPVKRGDKVTVVLTPSDGEETGKTATLTREIRNTPPMIAGHERFQVEDNVVSFHIVASDVDGDPLRYSLKDAPAGMRIDPSTGWVRWKTSPGDTGRIPFTVVVTDGAGGESSARINMTIREEAAPETKQGAGQAG